MRNPSPESPASRAGFTLIELLVVIAVIAILASLVLATSGYVQDRAARSRAEAEIAALSAALESYKADNGDYPLSSGTNSNKILLDSLMPTNTNSAGRVYFEFPKKMTNTSGNILDPYGNLYKYQYPGATNQSGTNFFDLWTTGKKASKGNLTQEEWEKQWIKNW